MSSDFIVRILGMVAFGFAGGYWGFSLGQWNGSRVEFYVVVVGLVGALFGLIMTPYFTTRPVRYVRSYLGRVSAEALTAGLSGMVVGLIIGALLSFPLSLLPAPFGSILPFVGALVFAYFGVVLFVMRQADIFAVFAAITGHQDSSAANGAWGQNRTVLLDTSVIIDGRIGDIAKTGFLPGTLLIPRFVLIELQYIADSSDGLRRARGRRGMEVLAELQRTTQVSVRISDIDVEGMREVDDKLVVLARQMKCPILTNDYNLNRVAELQGVNILNINELANAVKSVVLPGEPMEVQIIQEGKEMGQGVGYLEDGTMVVVEGGNKFLGQTKHINVTKVLQTAAGKMIFGRPEE